MDLGMVEKMDFDVVDKMSLDVVEKMSLDMIEKMSLDAVEKMSPAVVEKMSGKNFLNSRQNRTRRLVCPRRLGAFNAPIPFLETLPRVGLGLVVCAANNCRSSRRASCREVEVFPAVNRGTSLHCPPLRRVDASSSPPPYKCRALVHSSPIFIP
jgi:hypothetical protein